MIVRVALGIWMLLIVYDILGIKKRLDKLERINEKKLESEDKA